MPHLQLVTPTTQAPPERVAADAGLCAITGYGKSRSVGMAERRVTRRTRIAVVLAGLGAAGIYASYQTELGPATLHWHLD